MDYKKLPHTIEEQLKKLCGNPNANQNELRHWAYFYGVDFDDKYDSSFGRVEQAHEKENLQAN